MTLVVLICVLAGVPKVVEKIKKLKQQRDNKVVRKSLSSLKAIAKTEQNIMPAILDCAKAYCTLGEISDSMRLVFGEYGNAE